MTSSVRRAVVGGAAVTVALVGVLLLVDPFRSSPPDSTARRGRSATTTSTSPASGPGRSPYILDPLACEAGDDSVTYRGTIRNTAGTRRDFVVTVTVGSPSAGPGGASAVLVDDVEADETRTFTIDIDGPRVPAGGSCTVLDVTVIEPPLG
jgi:hypothetical protein